MKNVFDKEIQQKAREIARQISVAQDLGPEIQEELYGHIEDKLLAYMSGEEAVTEEDALILVREHLGNARVVGALLRDVHTVAPKVDWIRRLLVMCLVATVASVIAKTVLYLYVEFVYSFRPEIPPYLFGQIPNMVTQAVFLLMFTTLLIVPLRHWNGQMRAGKDEV